MKNDANILNDSSEGLQGDATKAESLEGLNEEMYKEQAAEGLDNPPPCKLDLSEKTPLEAAADERLDLKQRVIRYFKCAPKRVFITAMGGMAMGLFCTLIAGTIIQTIAEIFSGWATPVYVFLYNLGIMAKVLMGAGIGAGIAHSLKAPKLVVFSAVVAGFVGAYARELALGAYFPGVFVTEGGFAAGIMNGLAGGFAGQMARGLPGNPVNAMLAALFAVEVGALLNGRTKVDILVVPLVSLLVAGLIAISIGRPIDWFVGVIGSGINAAAGTGAHAAGRFFMSIIISLSMGLLLTSPFSSAAIGVAIGLSGSAAAAAVAGGCAHMIGFATASFKDNKAGGLVAQGLGTSMLQMPNVAKKPQIVIPAVIASLLGGPIAVMVFNLQSDPVGSGMGTAGFVGVIQTIRVSLDILPVWRVLLGVLIVCFLLPIAVSFAVNWFMRKKGWIKQGDMKLEL